MDLGAKNARQGVGSGDLQTVSRAAEVLTAFTIKREWGVSDLARHLGMSKSIVHRIISTLAKRNILRVDPDTSLYSIGDMVMRLARSGVTRPTLIQLARPLLEQARTETAETVTLCELNGDVGLCLDYADSPHSMRMTVYRGETFALSAGAIGKSLLAFQDEEFIEAYIRSGPLQQYTKNTITDAAALREELSRIRDRGAAYSEGEITMDATSVGVPVFEAEGLVRLSISVSAPSVRFTASKLEEVATLLRGLATLLATSIEASLAR